MCAVCSSDLSEASRVPTSAFSLLCTRSLGSGVASQDSSLGFLAGGRKDFFWGGGWENMPVRGSEIKRKRIAKLWDIKGLCDPWKVLYQQRTRTKNTGWCPKAGVPSMSVSTSSDSSVGQHWSVPLPLCHSAPGCSVSLGCCNKMSQAGWRTPELLKLGFTTPYLAGPSLVIMGLHCCLMLITYHVRLHSACPHTSWHQRTLPQTPWIRLCSEFQVSFLSFFFFIFPGKENQLL